MRAAWEVLHRGGVPLAGRREATAPSPAALADAAREAVALAGVGGDADADAELASEREREALGAWLRAWASHWPSSFAECFGPDAERILAWARAATPDHGRFLKLRRIALANLATLL